MAVALALGRTMLVGVAGGTGVPVLVDVTVTVGMRVLVATGVFVLGRTGVLV